MLDYEHSANFSKTMNLLLGQLCDLDREETSHRPPFLLKQDKVRSDNSDAAVLVFLPSGRFPYVCFMYPGTQWASQTSRSWIGDYMLVGFPKLFICSLNLCAHVDVWTHEAGTLMSFSCESFRAENVFFQMNTWDTWDMKNMPGHCTWSLFLERGAALLALQALPQNLESQWEFSWDKKTSLETST